MELRNFCVGLFLGALLVGCASFNYRYYGLDAKSYEGSLLGPEPKDDIPFTGCAPTDTNKSPCVVMLSAEFYRLAQDLQETKQRLKECQGGQ